MERVRNRNQLYLGVLLWIKGPINYLSQKINYFGPAKIGWFSKEKKSRSFTLVVYLPIEVSSCGDQRGRKSYALTFSELIKSRVYIMDEE